MSRPPAIRGVVLGKKTSMCIYADTGVGKTRLIGGGGSGTLILRPPTDNTDSIRSTGVQEWVIKDHTELLEAQDYLRAEGDEWDWVWWDSISLWQEVGLDDIWQATIDRTPDRAKYGLDKGEYGINMSRIGRFLRDMHGLSQSGQFNFGVTALPAELQVSQDPEAVKKLRPYVQGREMAKALMGYMNIVAFYEMVEQKGKMHRVLRVQPTERFDAKDQLDAFPKGRLVDPTWSDVSGAIEKARRRLRTERGSSKRPTRRKTSKRR